MLAHNAGRAGQDTGLVRRRGGRAPHMQRCRHHQATRLVSHRGCRPPHAGQCRGHQGRWSAPHVQQHPGSLRSCACRSPAIQSARRGGPPSAGMAGQSRRWGALQSRADQRSAEGALQLPQCWQGRRQNGLPGGWAAQAEKVTGELQWSRPRVHCAVSGHPTHCAVQMASTRAAVSGADNSQP